MEAVPKRFHGPTFKSRKGSNGGTTKSTSEADARAGKRYRNLRAMNIAQKHAKEEKAPRREDLNLKPVTEWATFMASGDTAHVLPAATSTSDTNSWLFVSESQQRSTDSPAPIGSEAPIGHTRETELLAPQPPPIQTSVAGDPVAFSIPNDTPASLPAGIKTRAINGRSWKPGQLVINLSLGDHAAGDFRVERLPPYLLTRLLRVKTEYLLKLHFEQQNVLSRQQYGDLLKAQTESRQPEHLAIASLGAYEDTMFAGKSLADHLTSHNLAALWSNESINTTIIMYSSKSPDWQTFRSMPASQLDTGIQWAVCSFVSLSPAVFNIDITSRSRQVPRPLGRIPAGGRVSDHAVVLSNPIPATQPSANLVRRSNEHTNAPPEAEPDENPPPGVDMLATKSHQRRRKSMDEPRVSTPTTNRRSESKTRKMDHVTLTGNHSAEELHPTSMKFNMSQITEAIQASKRDPKRARYYIAFGLSRPRYAHLVKQELQKNAIPRMIHSDAEKHDWEGFLEVLENQAGVVLFDAESPRYWKMYNLGKRLGGSDSLTCWNLSFERSQNTVQVFPTQVFPRGSVMLLTEGAMVENPKEALFALKWFQDTYKVKQSRAKIMLRPSARQWLLRKAMNEGNGQDETP